ncbi:MAG: Inositol 2-dehydrogenase/D-chiro-inositol 3-dehydrogenase [Verrucomicrobiae bacterium]|nr:Inositol 2-dehydrogenase/D-chiro-inositol 3-dehydrogenase [Verrucomicrobiae bacterium]
MKTTPSKYQIGIIGLGARAETFARELYAGTDRAQLFGLCDLDEDRTRKFVDYCGLKGARTFQNPEEFFAQKNLDAVIITTPDFTHRDVAVAAMQAGKHVYLEKPIGRTSAECRDIIRAQRETGQTVFVGFNMRASTAHERVKDVVQSGILGQIVHIEGLEQLKIAHSASFMRRFHRKHANTGGMLNHKCTHDLDIMQWFIGHEHRVRKVACFAGLNVFLPKKAPAKYCHECPADIYAACAYKDQAGFVFPVGGTTPIHHQKKDTYGGDLCVYTEDKDTFDNWTMIFEWDNGVRGNFNLQLFQSKGLRETRIWGELGTMHLTDGQLRTIVSRTGDEIIHRIPPPPKGGHGGADTRMLGRLIAALDKGDSGDSGLSAGLAATLVAEKALVSAQTGQVQVIAPEEFA